MAGIRSVQNVGHGAATLPAQENVGRDLSPFILGIGAVFLLMMLGGSLYDIRLLPIFLAVGTLLCVAVPIIRWPVISSAVWLILAGTTPEMWLGDIIGRVNTITAVVKVIGLALVVVCIVRYGARRDFLNPAFAYLAMFVVGLAHGLWPTMTVFDSIRSLVGSAAPFIFSFSRLSRRWCNAIIGATIWIPSVIVGFGILLSLVHLRPLFSTVAGLLRLQGSTHPAFLGGFAAAGIYAALVELYRDGRGRNLWAIVINYVILALSGARAPLACALMVTAVAFFCLRAESFSLRRRLPFVLVGMLALPILAAIASGSTAIRVLNILSSDAHDLSGRDLIWPLFRQAWNASPLFGWGVGAGKEVVDPDSLLAKLLGTTAAHNEYLRMGVEGGYFGLGLLIVLMSLWAFRWTRRACRTDRFIMRAVFVAFAVHSFTDNTLIAATASVMFTWVSAVFARAALEDREQKAVSTALLAQRQCQAAEVT